MTSDAMIVQEVATRDGFQIEPVFVETAEKIRLIDALAEAVTAAGGEVRWDEAIPGVRRFHTDDPVGNRVELQQA